MSTPKCECRNAVYVCWSVDRDPVSCLILLLSGEMSCLADNEITKCSPSLHSSLQQKPGKARKSFVYLQPQADVCAGFASEKEIECQI